VFEKARRPGLNALMADARKKKFSVVLVAAFDRIARSTKNFLQVVDELDSLGIEFVSHRGGVATGDAMGRLFVTIISAIAELERSLVVERVKSGMRRARLEGRQIGRSRLDVDRQQVIADRRSGMSLTQVAQKHGISRASVCRLMKPVFLVPDPPALRAQPFPSGHRRQRAYDRCFIPLPTCSFAQDTEAAVVVVESDPLDYTGDFFGRGSAFSVRTFAQQLKHAATDNYMLGAAILGVKPPADVGDETGPDSLRTKTDVIQYVKDSFAYLQRAVATIDHKNTVIDSPPISPMPKGTATRLGLADHYAQMVEYLRMNGVVPPASRLDAGGSGGMQ
jgi:hypothetical protein